MSAAFCHRGGVLIEVSWKDCAETKQSLLQDSLKRAVLLLNAMTLLLRKRRERGRLMKDHGEEEFGRQQWEENVPGNCQGTSKQASMSSRPGLGCGEDEVYSDGLWGAAIPWGFLSGNVLNHKTEYWWNTSIIQTGGSRGRKLECVDEFHRLPHPDVWFPANPASRIWLIFLNTIWVFLA